MSLPAASLELIEFHHLSTEAVHLQAAYLGGAQMQYLDQLSQYMGISKHAHQPGPASSTWLRGWSLHFDHLQQRALESTPERAIGLIAAAGLKVQERLYHATGRLIPLEVPDLYRLHMPKTFGHFAIANSVSMAA